MSLFLVVAKERNLRYPFVDAVETFRTDGTLWENDAPEYADRGERAKDAFVGWSGLFPISVTEELVL